MNASMRHHLSVLDRTIVHLLNERARLVAGATSDAEFVTAHFDDLARRSAGPFPSEALKDTFAAIDRGCEEVPS
ncbi:MAG: hypothetical protein ACI8X5_000660 [Planctomycetota bacterium]|jgi:hypothetical protein